jgi:hypothetical protein
MAGAFPSSHVLNYLGYSWIDQGVNLDEGMRMIKRAVEQRADDGYIVDLWAGLLPAWQYGGGQALERAIGSSRRTPPSTIISAMRTGGWDACSRRFQWSRARPQARARDLAKIEAVESP